MSGPDAAWWLAVVHGYVSCMCGSQARFLSRFTRASSGGKSGGSPRAAGDSGQAGAGGAAAGAANREGDHAAADLDDELGEGDEQEGTEVVDVDPAQLDRPEGAVGADAPDPEDADTAAVMQTDEEAGALRKAAQAEAPQASAAPAHAGSSATTSQTRAASRQAGAQPAQTEGKAVSNKQSQAADKKRRKTTGAAAGRRVTRARAGATAADAPAEASVPARSQRARPSPVRRSAAAEPAGNPTASEGAARQRDSSPAASSDCVLLGEAHEPEQRSVADSMPAPQADAPPPGGQPKETSSNADGEAAPKNGAERDLMQAPAMSDSEHSSAMAVEPRFTGDNDISSAHAAALACPSSGTREAAVPDPAAVQQVTVPFISLDN